MSDVTNGRRFLIQRAIRLRTKIQQIFDDCASWNQNVRGPGEPEIDCDPDGRLRRYLNGLDRMLAAEARRQQGVTS